MSKERESVPMEWKVVKFGLNAKALFKKHVEIKNVLMPIEKRDERYGG